MNGIICIYKEKGYTSFDVVALMRRYCGTRKIGHGGTLDPMAEGVLPIFIGNATKAVDYCPDNTKEYLAEMRFGVTTDTQDFTGTVLTTSDIPVSRNFQYILKQKFTGTLMQTPPMYSAVQVNGQRLYDLARKGIEVERQPREITIHALEFEDFGDNTAKVRVACSKGTYIRTLIHDMGQEVGTGAVMTSLIRTRSGIFGIEQCHRLSELKELFETDRQEEIAKLAMPLDVIFRELPAARLDNEQTRLFGNGVVLDAGRVNLDKRYEGAYRIMCADGTLTAIGKIGEANDLKVIQRFGMGENGGQIIPENELKDISELKGVRFS